MITKGLFPRLTKIVLVASLIDTLLNALSIGMNDFNTYGSSLPYLFIASFWGAFLFYFFFWIPVSLILELLTSHYFENTFSFKNLFIYWFSGIVALFLVYFVPSFLKNEFDQLIQTSLFSVTISSIIFYHSMLLFSEPTKKRDKSVGSSFLFSTVILLIFLTNQNRNLALIPNEGTEKQFKNRTEQEAEWNKVTKDIKEIAAKTPFELKVPTYLPGGFLFVSGMNYQNIEGDVVRLSYINDSA